MAQEMMMEQGMMAPENAGRGTDTVMAHLSLGEVVIPRSFLDDPDVMQMLQLLFQEAGADIAEFTVGDPANKINPETGYPEFGFFKSIKKIFKKVAPFIAPALSIFAPGIGTALGTALLGANATGAATLGNALIGGGLGAISGGAKGGLLGAATGGLSANIGSLPGNKLPWLPAGLQPAGATSGSGLLGALGNATGLTSGSVQGIGGLLGGSSGGGSSFGALGGLANAAGGLFQDDALKKQQKQLLAANQQQLANLDSFDPSGITSDPGYQFNLEQGQRGVNSSLGAQGSLFSGRALKAASEYNQNYADNAFKDYYNRWAQKTGAQNQLYGAGGQIKADVTGGRANNLAQSLSNAFGSPVGQYGQMDPNMIRRLLGLQGAY